MKVCIAEKPSVASSIAKVLGANRRQNGYYEGNGYQVTWTFGHLCRLKDPHEYNDDWKAWRLSRLPMIPARYGIDLINDKAVKTQFKVIKSLFEKACMIINCGDAGQEGELIQRWVMELAGAKCPVKRLWISSLTEAAIRQGFQSLHDQREYDSLYQAGLARAEGDWLLGMNATRLYTIKYGGFNQLLSIGRVQTPTLSMIVDRDKEIEHFIPEKYWLLSTMYRHVTFQSLKGQISSEQEAQSLLAKLKQQPLLYIKDVCVRKGSEQPPQLYDLTSLQMDCNRKYGMSAEQTLRNIQSLYEKKLTTYPRVDTKYLTDDLYAQCPPILKRLSSVYPFVNPVNEKPLLKSKRVFDNSKVADHHAIIPTGETDSLDTINPYERKVYELVVRRFCGVFLPDCEYNQTIVLASTGDMDFKATGRTILTEGWRNLYAKGHDEDENEDSDTPDTLPHFVVGERGEHQPSITLKWTATPKHYTEATLLQAMETAGKFVDDEELREAMKENGIGRPSSRSGIIETLLKRGYVKREKKALISTTTGKDLMEIIQSQLLKSPELTGQWEKKLRDIEHGHYTLPAFMNELEQQLRRIIDEVKADTSDRKVI